MRKLALLVVACLALLVTPAYPGTRSCTAGMVTLNICRTTNDVAFCLPFNTTDPDGAGPILAPSVKVAEAFAAVYGWQANMPCTADMVGPGICSAGQLGTPVPITKAQFADLQVRRYVLATIATYVQQREHNKAQTAIDAESAPDIGN